MVKTVRKNPYPKQKKGGARGAAEGMGRSPRERREREKPADLTSGNMPHGGGRGIDLDQTHAFFS
jgi:hypothetical protein